MAYGRRVEAERKLLESPVLFKTPSGFVRQSPWLTIANLQIDLMRRYMAEIGLTPASGSRIATISAPAVDEPITIHRIILEAPDRSGKSREHTELMHDGTMIISAADANL